MIIVSQDKDTIMNFENIEILGIGNPLEDDEGKFKILANTTIDNQYVIAKYTTEERAKEVLQEIASTYSKIGIVFDTFNGGQVQQLPIFEMPED